MATGTVTLTKTAFTWRDWVSIASSSDGTKWVAVNENSFYGNKVLRSTDSGATWTELGLNTSVHKIASSSDGTKLAVTTDNHIWTSADSGNNWTEQTNSPSGLYEIASSSDGSKLVACKWNGYICTSDDYGVSWVQRYESKGWVSIAMSSNGQIIYATDRGYIYKSIDGGATWDNLGTSGTWYLATSANGLIVLASGLKISTDGGLNWSTKLSELGENWKGVAVSSDGSVMAAVTYGNQRIYTSIDGGVTWITKNDAIETGNLISVRLSADGAKIVVGAQSGFLYTGAIAGVGIPASASAAISSNALQTYMSSSSATSVALAREVRAAIKDLTDNSARATAKADYISAMRAKEPTLKIAIPQTDFQGYINTFAGVSSTIEAAPKPIDVILPSASNIVDITTASVDETKYTAIEMPVNTTMTVQDNGSTVGTLTYDGSVYMDSNGATYSVGNSIIFGTKKVTILGQGSALVSITNTYKSIEVNLNVEISANGTIEVLGHQPVAPSNIVIASTLLPVDALYDSSNNIALIEFWEPDNLDDIMAQLASTQTLGGVEGYKITAKKLALGLQNCLIGELDAKSAEPFNAAPKYGAAGAQNGNRVMTGFGRFALMAYAHYIMGHVQATAAITNDTDFMKGMLSLNSDTLTDYKYANIGNYDGADAPWTTAGSASDANLAVRLVKALIDNNPTTSLVSNGAATTVANIVKQVIGQDASRATDEDNNKYSPENHGLLRFYPDDVIYVSINLTTPTVTVGTGQQVSGPTMEGLYENATGDKKYTLKLTLGPASA